MLKMAIQARTHAWEIRKPGIGLGWSPSFGDHGDLRLTEIFPNSFPPEKAPHRSHQTSLQHDG